MWHHKLGHLNYQSLHKLVANHMAIGIPYIPMHKEVCKSCQFGKQIRLRFSIASQNRVSKPLQFLHVDLCELLPTQSLNGSKYFMVIMDDFNHYIWVRFLWEKFQAFECFKTFKLMVELQLGIKIEVVWSDHNFSDNFNN